MAKKQLILKTPKPEVILEKPPECQYCVTGMWCARELQSRALASTGHCGGVAISSVKGRGYLPTYQLQPVSL